MEWVETTGKSVEEAKDAALDQLGVDENDAEFVVLSEPRSGLFGRIRGEARVRARVRPARPRPKQARSRRSEGRDAAKGSRSTSDRRKAGASKKVGASAAGGANGEAGGSGQGDLGYVAVTEAGTTTALSEPTEGGTRTRTTSRSRGGRRRGSARGPGQREKAADGSSDGGPEGKAQSRNVRQPANSRKKPERSTGMDIEQEEGVGENLSVEEQGDVAREFLEGLVEVLGLSASVDTAVLDADTVQVSVEGSGLGLLVGPGGGTLLALQELARTVVQGRTGGRSERILVDVAGYRAKRAEALQRFTKKIADEVLSSGAERALEPMSASDRKVVHDTVNELGGVVTRSVGEEPRRYIIVAPAPVEGPGEEDG